MNSKELPEEWCWAEIGKLGKVVAGGTPSTKVPEYWGDEIAWITPADLSGYQNKFISKGRKSISKLGLEKSSAKLMPKGSVLFSSRAPIGYVVIAANDICTNQGFKNLVPSKWLFNEYVYYFLKSAKQLAEKFASGTTFQELSGRGFAKLPIPLPPLPEQQYIVTRLEELFSDLDDGIASLKKAQEQLKTYRQAVLKYSFEGKLTAEWRKQHQPESAETLLEQIKTERERQYQCKLEEWQQTCEQATAAGKKKPPKPKKPKDLPPLTEAELAELPELPEGWCWTDLGHLKNFSIYGPRYSSKDYSKEGIVVLRTSDISEHGKVDFTNAPKLPLTNEEYEKYKLLKGDLLITRTGSIGTISVFNDNTKAIPGAFLIHYRLFPLISVWYIFYFLKSPVAQKHFKGKSAGVGRPNLNVPSIEELKIPFPSEKEQHQIVQEIEARLSVCDQLEQTIADSLQKAESLRQSILKQAFEGKLTEPWRKAHPNLISGEHSAAALLERIKEEKEKLKTEKNAKQMKLL